MTQYRILFQVLRETRDGSGMRDIIAIHSEPDDQQTLAFFDTLKQYAMPPDCRLELADIRIAELFKARKQPVYEFDDLTSVDRRFITEFGYALLARQGRITPLQAA